MTCHPYQSVSRRSSPAKCLGPVRKRCDCGRRSPILGSDAYQTPRTLRSVEESERDAVVSVTAQIGNITFLDVSEVAGICCEIAVEENRATPIFWRTASRPCDRLLGHLPTKKSKSARPSWLPKLGPSVSRP
jgi:hypothetical protein